MYRCFCSEVVAGRTDAEPASSPATHINENLSQVHSLEHGGFDVIN